jgi:hypothetical protein
MSIDPLALRVVNKSLEGIRENAVRDAEYIRDAWITYVEQIRTGGSKYLAAEASRLTEYSARLVRDLARYDGGTEIFRIMEDQ